MLVPMLMPDADEDANQRLGDAHRGIFKARFLESVRAFPIGPGRLARVHQAGQKVAFASSASKAELDHYLGLLDPRNLVAAPMSAADVENTKPAPASSRMRAASSTAADPNT
jgi:beta-phosphoglucomutase-like phosphatase (HAD superfamily)